MPSACSRNCTVSEADNWLVVTDNVRNDSMGNAEIAGMETDLNLDSSKYSIALVVFFIGYVICGVPSK